MPCEVVIIRKSYNSIYKVSLFVQYNVIERVDISSTKINIFVGGFDLVVVPRKTQNIAGLEREPQVYSHSNISGYASEII
jgi:hypothetical protein